MVACAVLATAASAAASEAAPSAIGQAATARDAPADSTVAPRDVRGRVILGSVAGDRGLGGQMVVLHRISSSGSGPLDSVRTRPDGSFRLAYRPITDVLYLMSVRYAGIGYFSAPLAGADGAPAPTPFEIVVFDTSSVARVAVLRGRHLIVSAPDAAGQRAIVEVFELANDSSVTLISSDDTSPVWRLHLPAGALQPRVGQGEFAADAVRFALGEVQLLAPLPPGLKQLVISYELQSSAFPLTRPMERASSVLEVLLEEPTGRVDGAKLTAQEPVVVGGRKFQRALAQDVDANAVISIVLPPVAVRTDGTLAWGVIPIVGLLALGAWGYSRRRGRRSVATDRATGGHGARSMGLRSVPDEEQLAHRAATLDALLAHGETLDPATRAAVEGERAHVVGQLRELLAQRTTRV